MSMKRALLAAAACLLLSPLARAVTCGTTINVTASATGGNKFTTISSAVAQIPITTLTSNFCITVTSGTYPEQVFITTRATTGAFGIYITSSTGNTSPIINPPAASTAAFRITNASVTISGFTIIPTSSIMYGVVASSAYVSLSSVNVQDTNSKIAVAGVAISSWSAVSYSSMTMALATADGFLVAAATNSTVSYSTAQVAGAGSFALHLTSATNNDFTVFTASNSLGNSILFSANSNFNTLTFSTMVSNGVGKSALIVSASSGNMIVNDYLISVSTALNVSGSTLTAIGGSVITATDAGASAVALSASTALILSSSTLTAPGYGVYLTTGNAGLMVLSTNTIQGAAFSIGVATQAAGAQVFITSNSITPTLSAAHNTFGLYLNGLATGATIQNNSIYYQTPVTNTNRIGVAVFSQSAKGLVIDHNQINQPGMAGTGSYEALWFIGTTNSSMTYNDVFSSGSLKDYYGLNLSSGSTGIVLRNNVFASSVTVTLSSYTISVAATSQANFVSDYNDWFSSNTLGFLWGATGYSSLAAWQLGSSKDLDSISGNPFWESTVAGSEDFHPMSTVGRWDPNSASFKTDGADSPTTDSADPGDAFANEQSPNGGGANQGSYGNTAEASKTNVFTVPGCAITRAVSQGSGPYTRIVDALTLIPGSLTGNACVVIEDAAKYPEQVTINNFTTNNFTITVEADPSSGLTPSVLPPASSTAAFQIMQTSANVYGITVVPVNAMPYGVVASSALVIISSVNVQDPGGKITTAGVAISSQSLVSYSSVTVGNAAAAGFLLAGSSNTTVSYSTAQAAGAGSFAVLLSSAVNNDFTVFTASNSLGHAVVLSANSNFNTITFSTMVSNGVGKSAMIVSVSSGNMLMNDYLISVSTALNVVGSTLTAIGGSVITATDAGASAVAMTAGDSALILSSSTLTALGYGVYVATGNAGLIVLSTNSIQGAQFGVAVATQAAGARVFITSNSITATLSAAQGTFGMYFNGLATGATIQNNSIYYQTPVANTNRIATALFSQSGKGFWIDHNQINEPGMASAGSYEAVWFLGTTNSSMTYNDVFSSGSLKDFYGLNISSGSTGVVLRNNVMMSSITVTLSSYTITVAATSQASFFADYNDWFSSNTLGFLWGATGYSSLAAWQAGSGKDPDSISGNPRWTSTVAGSEDFHPMSTVGRFLIGGGGPVTDGADSPTTDSADPGDPFSNEQAPNGGSPNLGSYGNTAEASESNIPVIPGCAVVKQVNLNLGPFSHIQNAVNVLPNSLTGNVCILIEDGSTYAEQVTVRNLVMNNFTLSIYADPSSGLTPAVSPPAASTAAFQIAEASVNVAGINVVPTNAMTFGVVASSAYVTLSSMSVQDPGGKITSAGVSISSWSAVSYSSVTVGNAAADGFFLPGSTNTTVSYSTAQAAGAGSFAVRVSSAVNNDFVVFTASNSLGGAVVFSANSNFNTITFSTMVSNGVGKSALLLSVSSGNMVMNDYLISVSTALNVVGSTLTAIGGSVITATDAGASAVAATNGCSALILSSSTLTAPGYGVYLTTGNAGLIVLSTNEIQGAQFGVAVATQAAGARVFITSNSITGTLSAAQGTFGLYFNGLATGATIQSNSIYYQTPVANTNRVAAAFFSQSGKGFVIDHNQINEPGMASGGSYEAIWFLGTTNSSVTYNDVFSSGSLKDFYGINLSSGSTGVVLRNNIIASSVTVTLSSYTITVAATSQASFVSDYNDWFSSNVLGFQWGANGYASLAAFQAGASMDLDSISANPFWESTVAGSEDFHPISATGRWDPNSLSFKTDGSDSPTIDSADPLDAFASEQSPNGGVANQGSYGNTAEASKTTILAPSGVALTQLTVSSAAVTYGLIGAHAYVVDASTRADFQIGTLVSSTTRTNAILLAPQSLFSNTTYFLRAGSLYGAATTYSATVITAVTLAKPPVVGASEFLSVQWSSVTVAWIAPFQVTVASESNEGYTLFASSNNFGQLAPSGAPVISSTSYDLHSTTLTVGVGGVPLDLSSTYYFQVGSLNWAGVPNISTFTRLNYQIAQSTGLLNIHNIDLSVTQSTVATSSMVVTNLGNWPATIQLAASTITTPSSFWSLGTSPGVEQAALQGVWFTGALGPPAVGPAPSAFTTYITTAPVVSQLSGNYSSASQNGFELAPGANITLWFRFFFPTSTSSPGHEAIQVTAQPLYP